MRRGLEPAVRVKLSHDALVDQIFDFESADLSLPAPSKRTFDFRIGGEHAGQAIDEAGDEDQIGALGDRAEIGSRPSPNA